MDEPLHQSDTEFKIGEDLYGVSVAELEQRIIILHGEINRIETELAKKKADLTAADSLFAKKDG